MGALHIYITNINRFKSVSALSPIGNPTKCPWVNLYKYFILYIKGEEVFKGFLGSIDAGKDYDIVKLID